MALLDVMGIEMVYGNFSEISNSKNNCIFI